MSLPQGSCPMCDTVHYPSQPHSERKDHPSNFSDNEPGKQKILAQWNGSNRDGIQRGNHKQQDEEMRSEHTLNGQSPSGTSKEKENSKRDGGGQKNVAHKRSSLRNHISNFQWQWFACTMSTGGLALTLSETPHQFQGLQTIGKVFFLIQLVLFVIFTCTMGLRFILDSKALVRSLTDPTESFFFGCFWLSQATIIGNIQRYGVPSCGPWLIKAQEVLLWYYVGVTLLVGIFMFTTHFARHDLSIDKVQPSWVLAIYPTMLAGTLASLLAPTQPTGSALAMIIGGIALQGLGFMVSFMLITIFLWRCFNTGLPPAQMRVGMFISVGMPGYTATALQGIAQAAQTHFPPGYMGVQTLAAADVLVVASVAVSAWLWLFSFILFGWAVVSIAFGVRKMEFDVTWWACIFPNVGWVVATSLLGQTLNSQGIQWVASAMTILLVVAWLFVAVFHLKAIFQARSPPAI